MYLSNPENCTSIIELSAKLFNDNLVRKHSVCVIINILYIISELAIES